MIIGRARSFANLTIDQRQHPNDKKKEESKKEKKMVYEKSIVCVPGEKIGKIKHRDEMLEAQ